MSKKLIAILSAGVLSMTILTGCASTNDIDNNSDNQTKQEQPKQSKEYEEGYKTGQDMIDTDQQGSLDEVLYTVEFSRQNSENPETYNYSDFIKGLITAIYDNGKTFNLENGDPMTLDDAVKEHIRLYEAELDKMANNQEKFKKEQHICPSCGEAGVDGDCGLDYGAKCPECGHKSLQGTANECNNENCPSNKETSNTNANTESYVCDECGKKSGEHNPIVDMVVCNSCYGKVEQRYFGETCLGCGKEFPGSETGYCPDCGSPYQKYDCGNCGGSGSLEVKDGDDVGYCALCNEYVDSEGNVCNY